MTTYSLWDGAIPAGMSDIPTIDCYLPEQKRTDTAFLILPGGAYTGRAPHEGAGYAEFLNEMGISAFVAAYRVFPNHFPAPLLDARRAVRFLRANAERFGIDPDRIIVIGSSAGGHLAALLSTYRLPLVGEGVDALDKISPYPNAQVLCYPVISSNEAISHRYSYEKLLGDRYPECDAFSPELLVPKETPLAFIWHTAEDSVVNVENSYCYGAALRRAGVPCEMHVFPFGPHGLGVAPAAPHVAQWVPLLKAWLVLYGFLPGSDA